MSKYKKLTAYVDETGQDTRGQFFLVAVLVSENLQHETLRDKLIDLERSTKKGKKKWKQTHPLQRSEYLSGLLPVLSVITPVYWRDYHEGTNYPTRTAEATLAAMSHRDPTGAAKIVVIVDGLNWKERTIFARVFRSHRRKWHKLTGGRDESDPLLRLADAMAGFLRDVREQDTAALKAWKSIEQYFYEL